MFAFPVLQGTAGDLYRSHTRLCRTREPRVKVTMIFPIIDLISEPDVWICNWRDGELFVECPEAASQT